MALHVSISIAFCSLQLNMLLTFPDTLVDGYCKSGRKVKLIIWISHRLKQIKLMLSTSKVIRTCANIKAISIGYCGLTTQLEWNDKTFQAISDKVAYNLIYYQDEFYIRLIDLLNESEHSREITSQNFKLCMSKVWLPLSLTSLIKWFHESIYYVEMCKLTIILHYLWYELTVLWLEAE